MATTLELSVPLHLTVDANQLRYVTVSLPWSGDFTIDDSGRIVLVSGDEAFIERLYRRILTTPRLFDNITGIPIATPDYLFSPTFGAGLRRAVDTVVNVNQIKRLIQEQVSADKETDRSKGVVVDVVTEEGTGRSGVRINVKVARANSSVLAFSVFM